MKAAIPLALAIAGTSFAIVSAMPPADAAACVPSVIDQYALACAGYYGDGCYGVGVRGGFLVCLPDA